MIDLRGRIEVVGCDAVGQRVRVHCTDGRSVLADAVWCATGGRSDVRLDPLFTDLVTCFPATIVYPRSGPTAHSNPIQISREAARQGDDGQDREERTAPGARGEVRRAALKETIRDPASSGEAKRDAQEALQALARDAVPWGSAAVTARPADRGACSVGSNWTTSPSGRRP